MYELREVVNVGQYEEICNYDFGFLLDESKTFFTVNGEPSTMAISRFTSEEGKSKIKNFSENLSKTGHVWQSCADFVDFNGPHISLMHIPDTKAHIDIHVHLQSNQCAPLPLVWEKSPLNWNVTVDANILKCFAEMATSEWGRIARQPTVAITREALAQKNKLNLSSNKTTPQKPLTALNCVGMDMTFGNLFCLLKGVETIAIIYK